jgi:hypothetical protein
MNGNGVSIEGVSEKFKFSVGTIVSWTAEVIEGLVELVEEWIPWPDAARRAEISASFERNFGVSNCIGLLDGTLVRLYCKPALQPEQYWDRKKNYSFNIPIVCDDKARIIGASFAPPGSCHDIRAWRFSDYHKNPERYFDLGQWLGTDLGYCVTRYLQPPFTSTEKSIKNKYTAEELGIMNKLWSRLRVTSERCYGILKGRWASLQGLRKQIRNKEEIKSVIDWMLATCVLHNMLTDFGDELPENEWCPPDDDDDQATPDSDEADPRERDYVMKLREKVAESVLIACYNN